MDIVFLIASLVLSLLVAFLIYLLFKSKEKADKTKTENDRLRTQIYQLQATVDKHPTDLAKQRGSLFGKGLEKFLPEFPNYPYNPLDVVAVFDTVDFIVLEGRNKIKAGEGTEIEKVVFQDIKYGLGEKGENQRALERCIRDGRVVFEIWRVNPVSGVLELRRTD